MGYLIIDYIISFIVLLVIHAPLWAWVIYVVSAVVWLLIGVAIGIGEGVKSPRRPKQE